MEPEVKVELGRPYDEWEQHAFDSMVEFGEALGTAYERVWDAPERMVEILNSAAAAEVDSVLANRPKAVLPDGAKVVQWSVFGAGLVSFGVMANMEPFSAPGWIFFLLWVGFSILWFWLLARHAAPEVQHKKDGETLRELFIDAAVSRAIEGVVRRRVDAQSHTPSDDLSLPFEPKGPMPLPQQYGVSHEGAEHLVAEWMRYFGEEDAEVTRFSGDGGIDVQSLHYIAQVKNYTGSVQVAEVRELAGVASADGRKPLFFTSGTYAAGAVDFANRIGMQLFRYDAIAGSLHEENELNRPGFRS